MYSTMTSLLTRVLSFGSTASTGSRFDDEVYRRDFISDLREHTITLAEDIWRSFWEPDVDLFCNKRPSAETVPLGMYNGYTVWTFTLGLQSLIEAEKLAPGKFGDKIASAIETLQERYYNPEFKAYSAWIYSPGDTDVYYDDNAQIAVAFIDAYNLLHDDKYLELARSLCHFLITGWSTNAQSPGGVQWHVGDSPPNTDRCCCSTAITGIALLKVAQSLRLLSKKLKETSSKNKIQLSDEEKDWVALHHENEETLETISNDVNSFTQTARSCGDWLLQHLWITEADRKGDALTHLIADKLTEDTSKERDDIKTRWRRDENTILSYNTGTTLQLLCLLLDKDLPAPTAPSEPSSSSPSATSARTTQDYQSAIHILASTAITPYKLIFNTTAPNPSKRIWADHPYFTHLLIEGLLAYTALYPTHPKRTEIQNMLLHNVAFMKDHLCSSDPAKGKLFYHRNLKLTRISKGKEEEWNTIMGVSEHGTLDETERVYDEAYLEVQDREMARTLLAQAGVARGFALVVGGLEGKGMVEEEARRTLMAASLSAGDW